MSETRDPLNDQLNATLTRRYDIAPGLAILRVEADRDLFEFRAGQYCVLGLPPSFKRLPSSEEEPERTEKQKARLIRRAYSIASSSKLREYLEFYITLVSAGELTPRLFALAPGDRLWVGPNVTGHFTLESVPPDANLYLISTGTGLAPYMSMLETELSDSPSSRRVVIAHGGRYSWDLGYRAELEVLTRRHDHLTYLPSITRPQSDGSWAGETGYLQDQLADGRLEQLSGVPLDPGKTHVYLCGNPSMIEKTTELLLARGFSEWSSRENPSGTIHTEKYW